MNKVARIDIRLTVYEDDEEDAAWRTFDSHTVVPPLSAELIGKHLAQLVQPLSASVVTAASEWLKEQGEP